MIAISSRQKDSNQKQNIWEQVCARTDELNIPFIALQKDSCNNYSIEGVYINGDTAISIQITPIKKTDSGYKEYGEVLCVYSEGDYYKMFDKKYANYDGFERAVNKCLDFLNKNGISLDYLQKIPGIPANKLKTDAEVER